MTALRKAAQQALEALEWHYRQGHSNTLGGLRLKIDEKALRKLRAALVGPVQEPVAYMSMCFSDGQAKPHSKSLFWPESYTGHPGPIDCGMYGAEKVFPLYTAPPQRKPLTDEEIEAAYRQIWRNLPDNFDHTSSAWIEQGVRYAEAAHGIGSE